MKKPDDIDTLGAEGSFAVANTPLFLLRKLRGDPAVIELARNFSASDILRALKKSIRKRPHSLSDSVRPYVYLIALSIVGDAAELKEASTLAAPDADWFSYLANFIFVTHRPTTYTKITVPNTVLSSTVLFQSHLPTTFRIIEIGK